jgi:hypothetical protein
MPTLAELQRRYGRRNEPPVPKAADEVLIADPRGTMTPAEMVERKLQTILAGTGFSSPGLPPPTRVAGRFDADRSAMPTEF